MINVGTYLMELRELRRPKLSRAQLAALVGSTEMNISRIERGQEPSGGLLIRLAKTLGASWDTIVQLSEQDDNPEMVRQLVAEARQAPQGTPEEQAVLSRLLDLLEQGYDPAEAARLARSGQ